MMGISTGSLPAPPPPRPPSMPPPEGAPSHRPPERRVWPLVVAGVAVLALVASLTMNVVQARRASELADEVEALETELAAAQDRIEELAAAAADDDDDDEGGGGGDEEGGGLLDGLDDLGGLDLDELMEGFGGGGEGFGDIFEDLFGGGGGEGLEDLLDGLGGGGQLDLISCLTGGPEPGSLEAPTQAAPQEQVAIVAEQVAELRELSFERELDPTFLGAEEFEQTVFDLFEEDYPAEDAELDGRILVALGALEPGSELRQLFLDLISEQAAGFYSTETEEIVVKVSDPDEPLSMVSLLTLAHEVEHALADQTLGLPGLDDEDLDSDAALAGLSVIEGDAVLSQQQYLLAALGFEEQTALASDPLILESQEQLASYPYFLQRELLFPYEDGLAFACGLYDAGGWEAVNEAYASPPTTTAEVLFPERYIAGEQGGSAPALGEPGGGFTSGLTDTFGAAELRWLFEAPGDDPSAALEDPSAAAAAWDAGALELWTDGDASALGVALAQREGEADLCDAVTQWYSAAFPDAADAGTEGDERLAVEGSAQSAVVTCADAGVRLGIAPDLDAARAITG